MTRSASLPGESLNASWRAALTQAEVEVLLKPNDWRSWISVGINWGLIAASFALVAVYPNLGTALVAVLVIGARQLGCAVLMHEAAHRTLFSDRRLNDWAGQWLCAYPIGSDLESYRGYHLQHHARTGADDDPDIGLARPFPITRKSLWRKLRRDLSGRTGLKFAQAVWKRSFARAVRDPRAARAARGLLLTNGLLLGALVWAGRPELYALWAVAWLTSYTLSTRIRSIAEHAMVPDRDDPLGNTRTTLASGWERLLLAPNRVNYHLEHHLLMTVPHYRLPRMHALLRERGVRGCVDRGYLRVLRRAASRPEGGDGAVDDEADLARVNGL